MFSAGRGSRKHQCNSYPRCHPQVNFRSRSFALNLQGRNILTKDQRDIHLGNVLVQSKYFANIEGHEKHCRLADLGEGIVVDERVSKQERNTFVKSAQSLDLRPYKAPEINRGMGYSKQSDVYAFGQLGFDVISINYESFQNADGLARVPAKLIPLLHQCKHIDPHKRCDAKFVERAFDEMVKKLENGRMKLEEYDFSPGSAQDWSSQRTIWSTT